MSVSTRVGTAVAAGYVFGRFRKLRLAVIAGTALANKQVRDAGLGMIRPGSGQEATGSDGMGRQLVDGAKSAATAAVATRMNHLSDRLHERTVALGGDTSDEDSESPDEPEAPEDQYDDDEYDDEEEYDDEPEASEDEYDEDEYDDEPEASEDDESSETEHRSPRRRRAAAPVGGR